MCIGISPLIIEAYYIIVSILANHDISHQNKFWDDRVEDNLYCKL